MIVLVDNYDSFTYNLYQYLGGLGQRVEVVRNDEVSVAQIADMAPEYIVISAGPCTPNEAGISMEVIDALGARIPVLGVCLGHQCIGQLYGGSIVRAPVIKHGMTDSIEHNGGGIFADLPSPFTATLYNSLLVSYEESAQSSLEITAWSRHEADRLIMGLKHRSLPIEGVQFHPESILSEYGLLLMASFLNRYRRSDSAKPIDTSQLPTMVR